LLRHGDFGLGTYNSLDGEMLVLDGACYQLRGDGSATVADLDELTPFAAVTWFHPDHTIEVSEPCDSGGLKTPIRIPGSCQSCLSVNVHPTRPFCRPWSPLLWDRHAAYRPEPNERVGVIISGANSVSGPSLARDVTD
jgi:acetolactate decarboxylase